MPQKDGIVTKTNVVEAPSTHGRPVSSFNFGSRKNFPSKWDNAEKWLIHGHESPAHGLIKSADFAPKQQETREKSGAFSDNEEKVRKVSCILQGPKFVSLDHHHCFSNSAFNGVSALETSDMLLKDKFTDEVELVEVLQEAKNRDTRTEMTLVGSSTTSRCPTPLKSRSPPRHNTPLGLTDQASSLDINDLQEWHFSKLQRRTLFDVIASKWSSRDDEEEDDVSKSLKYSEMKDECLEIISGPRSSAWEEKEKSEYCVRYQMEEAKIQAWVNLQKAKAEAESRKLEVKIQKMRSKYEEKLMKKMIVVDRKAEELRAAAQLEHSEQVGKISGKSNNSMINLDRSAHFPSNHGSCVCFIRK